MTPEVFTFRTPNVLAEPLILEELNRWQPNPAAHEHLLARMTRGTAALIVGSADPIEIQSFAIVTLPEGVGEDFPWVTHFVSRGPKALTKSMVEAVLALIQGAGYSAFRALNLSGYPDKVWLRAFKNAGEPVFVGSTYLFDLGKGVSDGGSGTIRSADRRGGRDRAVAVRLKAKADPAKLKRKHRDVVPVVDTGRHDAAGVRRPGTNRRGRPRGTVGGRAK